MAKFLRLAAALGLLLAVCACGNQDWVERLTTRSDRQFGNEVLAQLRAGEIAQAKAVSSPDLSRLSDREWEQYTAAIPRRGESRLVTASSNSTVVNGNATTFKSLNYEVGSGDQWAVAQISMTDSDRGHTLVGFRIFPSRVQPTRAAEFSLDGKGALNFAFLALMVASLAVCLAGAYLAFKNRDWKGRWLWIVGSLVGVGSISLVWSTGELGYRLIHFQLLGGGFMQPSPFESWIFSVSVPVVALSVIARHLRGRNDRMTHSIEVAN